jgi:hypothetical protein
MSTVTQTPKDKQVTSVKAQPAKKKYFASVEVQGGKVEERPISKGEYYRLLASLDEL